MLAIRGMRGLLSDGVWQRLFGARLRCSSKSVSIKERLKDVPNLSEFMRQQAQVGGVDVDVDRIPLESKQRKKAYVDVYGCQMNVQDTEVVWRVLTDAGYERANAIEEVRTLRTVIHNFMCVYFYVTAYFGTGIWCVVCDCAGECHLFDDVFDSGRC
jgi:hypothetical protein